MSHKIKTVYVIHHSHTDIGYTDLQENVLEEQSRFIYDAMKITENDRTDGFRWNCETLFCVERFLAEATESDRSRFLALVKDGKMGLSANYLNFTDLADAEVLNDRLAAWQKFLIDNGIKMNAAMCADINGVSMGFRDALINNGIEFLYTNINTDNGFTGMYPLDSRHRPFFWETGDGKRLLVWNAEHYNLGNALWLHAPEHTDRFRDELYAYLTALEDGGYPYDFFIMSVSGVYSDNAPPNAGIYEETELFNKKFPTEPRVRMVTLSELYGEIKDKLTDAPVYRGDFTDWWADGVGGTPVAVKHYREAQRIYSVCKRLDKSVRERFPRLARTAEDNLMLYSEHTWGHAMSVREPYNNLCADMNIRKTSYASKAHEAASTILKKLSIEKGEIIRYYANSGKFKVSGANSATGKQIIQLIVRNQELPALKITDENGNQVKNQLSPHSYGSVITFADSLEPFGEKVYSFKKIELISKAETGLDIENGRFENKYFSLDFKLNEGILSFKDKARGAELTADGKAAFFTPIYQRTPIEHPELINAKGCERHALGRNIAADNTETFVGRLTDVQLIESGDVFTAFKLCYALPGTTQADVVLRFYADLPRVDFSLQIAKKISADIESIFLPLKLNFDGSELSIRKGAEAFRPGIDQLPNSCMDYYITDDGVAYTSSDGSALIACLDVPLIYAAELHKHEIKLCNGKTENNTRPIYSWVMNNKWGTNFQPDLSGYASFDYSLWLSDEKDNERAIQSLHELVRAPLAVVIE